VSIYAIANKEVAISAAAEPQTAEVPAPTGASVATIEAPPATAGIAAPAGAVSKALKSIGTYIPTEVMATYLAILAIVPTNRGHGFQWLMFWLFLIATPLVVWLGIMAAHKSSGRAFVGKPISQWPWWSMIAATVAFAAFVLVLPGSVMNDVSWYEAWMGSVAIILSAFVLGLGDQVFGS